MIRWFLRALGAQDEHPQPLAVRFPPTDSEMHYECVRQEAERVIARADGETRRSRQQLGSWEEFYDPHRRPL